MTNKNRRLTAAYPNKSTWRFIMSYENTSFAFSKALALESADRENFSHDKQVYEFTSDQLVNYAAIVAYKTFHNVKGGAEMDAESDPITVNDKPAKEVWASHYYSAHSPATQFPKLLPNSNGTFSLQSEGTPLSLGEVVYNAYCDATNWKSVYSGADLPEYNLQRPEVIAAWEAGAMALLKMFSNLPVPPSTSVDGSEGPIGSDGCCGGPDGYDPTADQVETKESVAIDSSQVGSVENALGLSPESDESAGDETYALKA
jgi:hypothetical protein